MSWSLGQNAFATLVDGQVNAGVSLLDLTSSNPTSCVAPYPHASIHEAFAGIDDFRYDPQPFGILAARQAIVQYYAGRGIAVEENQILLTASTSEAYGLLFKLLCNPGEEILIPTPSYPLFEYLAALEGIHVQPYHLRYDGAWYLDLSDLEQRISSRTKAIVVVNPNNPTGTYLTVAEQDELVKIAAKHRLPLICDEVFLDYGICARSAVARTMIGTDAVLSFSLSGLSKAAGMPQLKLAWIVMNGSARDRQAARERLEILSDTYLSVATPVQKALEALLSTGEIFQEQIRKRLTANIQQIDSLLNGTSAHRLQMDAGWSAILQVPKTRSEEDWITGLLQEQHVVVQPGYFFDMPPDAYLVISLLTEPLRLRDGLERIKAYLHRHR